MDCNVITSQQNVSLHLKNTHETGELDEGATYKKILFVRQPTDKYFSIYL